MRFWLILFALAASLLVSAGPASGQETISVEVGDFYFCDSSLSAGECTTTITAGDTVIWEYSVGTAGHTVTECGDSCDSPTDSPLFDSGRMLAGDTFSFTFSQPGTYLYYCEFHPIAMRATVVVQAQPTPSPTVAPTDTPAPSPTVSPTDAPTPAEEPTPAITTTPTLQPTASPASPEPNDDDSISPLWFIAGGSAGLLVLAAAAIFILPRVRA